MVRRIKMIVEKNNKSYNVTESDTKWKISLEDGKLSVAFEVSKNDCVAINDVQEYIMNNEIF